MLQLEPPASVSVTNGTDQSPGYLPPDESQMRPEWLLDQAKNTAKQQLSSILVPEHQYLTNGKQPKRSLLQGLYSSNVVAKIWGVAAPALFKSEPPTLYPEYTKPGGTRYVFRELDFWTSGFFPGSLYLLLERERRFKRELAMIQEPSVSSSILHPMHLEFACKWWTTNLHQNSTLASTHDLGFMIFPWAKLAWTLDHDILARDTIIRASRVLASRYVPATGAIRSWDTCTTLRYSFTDPTKDFLFIIDNMMNLDMLFWTASETGDQDMYQIAVNHAKKTQACHIRTDYSTTHLVVLDPNTGSVKSRLTNQGYSDTSSWTRGQAWAIAGFAQTYNWTRDASFLETSRACADYFLSKLPANGVPPWDFCAPTDSEQPPDTSAAVIAAYGMLLIHEALHMTPQSCFVATTSTLDTVEQNMQNVQTEFTVIQDDAIPQTILGGATINNYEFAPRRWANHGLVYADYYFLLLGNKLLEMQATMSLSDIQI
ncbi:glycosyl hydrolase family 88 domain-containing protein [Trichoderma breve]|uniref:Glycosyl hydrolase family 88 domain-containing protein n=1 Tax=Trichoderma breve TaxID=2034170 RepID=A0A9W9B309_9HYPO|nr:glycosyl hydrolase family 88 domain-containing protein [Trichoderma breve]KAJ4854339.1 glycosyl hydrolase family 88 domain-containing protein [Trichoderma breve]